MLNIIYGPDWRENRKTLLHTICTSAAGGEKGHILIVPDQFSHEAERALLSAGGDTICTGAEVLSFSRLAQRVASIYGGAADIPLDNGGRLCAAAAAIEQVRSQLKIYGSCATKPEFLRQLLDTLDECKAFRIGSKELMEASRSASGVLGQKLEEIALLIESYEAVCANGSTDPSTRLMKLFDTLQDCDFAAGKHFYLEGFADFNGLETDIVSALLETSGDVTLVLLCDDIHEGQPVFDGVRATARQLERIAEKLLIETSFTYIPAGAEAPALTHLKKELFSGLNQKFPEDHQTVTYASYPDEYSEVLAAAGTILKLTAEGARYRDLSIACGNMAVYQPIMQAVFSRYSIPAYYSGTEDILSKPVIRTVLSALEAATNNLECESVFAFLKSGIDLIPPDRCNRLENYVITWGILGKDYRHEWTLPLGGYGERTDERALCALNEDRATLESTLVWFRDKLYAAANTGEMVLALHAFLEKIRFANRLSRLAEQASAQGKLQQAQEYQQLYGILNSALEQLYNLLAKTVRTPEEFFRLVRAMLSEYNVGTIPAQLDAVSVGSVMSQRQNETKTLLVLGANDGCFPASPVQTGLLSEAERKNLLALGLSVAPGEAFRLNRELHGIYNVLCGAREKIRFSAVKDSEAFLFLRLQELFEPAPKEAFPLAARYSPAAALELACSSAEAGERLAACIPGGSEALHENLRRASHTPGDLSEEGVRALYGERLFLSASRVDKQSSCRLAYFLNYGLEAKERRQVGFDAPDYGKFVHYVLEHMGKTVRDEGGFQTATKERITELTQQYIDEYIREKLPDYDEKPERFVYLFRRNLAQLKLLAQEVLDEMQQSDFTCEGFEVNFGENGQLDAISIVGKHAESRLEGMVDRVDLYRNGQVTYLRVVDYKTGKKAFDLTDILNGIGLQMLIYLFALEQNGQALYGETLVASGVIYFPAHIELKKTDPNPDEKAIEKAQTDSRKREGLLLCDDIVLHAMGHGENPKYLPYSFKKDGSVYSNNAATKEQFIALKKYVYETLSRMTDEIASGVLTPNPYWRDEKSNACMYCPYGGICHVEADVVKKRVRKKVNPPEFWKAVEEGRHE